MRTRSGSCPDLRLQWLDFCRFKTYLNNRFWFQQLTGDIRTYDDERVVIAYNVHDFDGLLDKIDYTHGGGVMKLPANGERTALWEKHRIGNCQEPHHPHRPNAPRQKPTSLMQARKSVHLYLKDDCIS